jgi:hypothetical protein
MKLFSLLFMLFLLPVASPAHPLHLSVTNITLENGKLKISMKTFRDDWETAYFHFHSKVIDLADPVERAKPWLKEYLNSHFKISLKEGSGLFPLAVDTIILEENAMTIEMNCNIPPEPNSLYIYNALLTDIYPDQTNLLILGFKKKETGIKFDVKKNGAEVMLK